jgi:hypothetical protein
MKWPVTGPLVRAALFATMLAAGCAAGATSQPTPGATPVPSPIATPASDPSDPESTDIFYPDFVPPEPLCPAPPNAVKPPTLTVGIKGGPPRTADMGSSSVTTCSTVGTEDRELPDPKAPIIGKTGDLLVFTASPGWRILAWSESDHPRNDEGTNIIPDTPTPERATSFEVPIWRRGDSIIGVDVWCLRADGRAIANVSALVWVRAS